MTRKPTLYTIVALLSGTIYIIWLYSTITSSVGILFLIQEIAVFFLFVLFVINHSRKKYQLHGGAYSLRAQVDIFIPTKNEPIDLLERTIKSSSEITSPNKRIYVIDDGARVEVKILCEKYQVTYLVRPDREIKAYKAATLNFALSKSFGNFILTLDADQWVAPNILDDILGYFKDAKVAIVTTRQAFEVPEDDFNHDHLFYEHMQPGKNASDSAMSCGSGVIYRRSALNEIKGFQDWNIIEDLYTSYVLNQRGYKSVYVSQAYTKGEAPLDLKTIYKQRGIWAADTLRLFFWKQPLLNFKLTLRQRLLYFEMGYIYLVSAIVIPSIYLLNFYSLYANHPILNAGIWYPIVRLPSFFLILKVYNDLGRGSSTSRMWAALYPVFFKSTLKALLYTKPKYVVTVKGALPKRNLSLVLPQFITILIGIIGLIFYAIIYGVSGFLTVNVFWICVMIYWLWPVFPKAFVLNKNMKPQEAINLSQIPVL